jgi:hypothetical protein
MFDECGVVVVVRQFLSNRFHFSTQHAASHPARSRGAKFARLDRDFETNLKSCEVWICPAPACEFSSRKSVSFRDHVAIGHANKVCVVVVVVVVVVVYLFGHKNNIYFVA